MRNPILPLLIFLFLLTACQSEKSTGYTVTGEVAGLESPALLLMMLKQSGFEIETIPVENGRFSFSGQVDEPYFVQLLMLADADSFRTTGKLTEFLLENSDIRIEGTSPEFEDVTVQGSESDRILKEYFTKDSELLGQTDERVELLKESVKRHRASIVGALLPIFCTFDDVLTSEDYIDMFESLTEEMQQTGYGQMVLQRSASRERESEN